MERSAAPSLLPILRSRQQGELLAILLGDPDLELTLSALANHTGVPAASVHREVKRAETAGLVTSRRVGNVRLVRANTDSPYYAGLSDVLIKAFGVPRVLGDALGNIDGIDRAFVFGSWAARFFGVGGERPIGDIDVLVLGEPDRDALFEALHRVEDRLGRRVEVTVRSARWIETGSGSFHDTVTSRPLVQVELPPTPSESGQNHSYGFESG